MANEADKDTHYCDRSSGWTHTMVVLMGLIVILVINLALDQLSRQETAIKIGNNICADGLAILQKYMKPGHVVAIVIEL